LEFSSHILSRHGAQKFFVIGARKDHGVKDNESSVFNT
jgi:hypothetical protein